MTHSTLDLPREKFEPITVQPLELDALGTELMICFQDLGGPREIRTCYGDICKIVNTLRDYARILRMVCEEWNLQGEHRAIYEIHADKLEEISKNIRPASATTMTRLWRSAGKSGRSRSVMTMWAARRWQWPTSRPVEWPLPVQNHRPMPWEKNDLLRVLCTR